MGDYAELGLSTPGINRPVLFICPAFCGSPILNDIEGKKASNIIVGDQKNVEILSQAIRAGVKTLWLQLNNVLFLILFVFYDD